VARSTAINATKLTDKAGNYVQYHLTTISSDCRRKNCAPASSAHDILLVAFPLKGSRDVSPAAVIH